MIRQLSDKVFYIGTDDLTIDLFESQYVVPDGVSYNSYLINDSKIAILDTSDARKGEEWLGNLQEALGDRTPDYLVVHHMEPDHSALIAKVLGIYPGLTLVASAQAIRMLPQFFQDIKIEGRCRAVKEGDTLELGGHSLRFIAAPMVHWPEVMVSFDESDGTLYSADGFGKFGALGKCGFYGRDDDDWACEARRYYFNIVGKYGAQVQQLLKKAAGLPIKAIRPLHGPLLEDNLQEYISLYDTWSRYEPESEGIFIACASIHGGTLEAAEMLAQILRTKGAGKVVVSDLSRTDIAENVEDAFRYPTTIFAAASYDAGLFTPMYEFMHRLQIKGWCKRRAGLLENGSWAPSAGRVMKEMLGTMKDIELVEPVVTIRSRMHREDFPAMDALADAILK
ncbi:MAG: MBL fold metallo-hydrolase [Bacteroidales bacterium]|nr:MBL fold metallo-hydrolase [Bacteroidales bacterium]